MRAIRLFIAEEEGTKGKSSAGAGSGAGSYGKSA
jgi:hypothetical protein